MHPTVLKMITLVFFIGFVFTKESYADIPLEEKKSSIVYQTSFGHCPNRPAGEFVLRLTKIFEETHSLRALKKSIIQDKLCEKHFVSEYQINYDPFRQTLKMNFDCPRPLMKVAIYKNEQGDSYEAILVDNGELYDPSYETLLRTEHQLNHELPSLALPIKEMEKDVQKEVTKLIKTIPELFLRKFSEVIVGEEKKLIIILSVKNQPCSAFLGNDSWDEKMISLIRLVTHLEQQGKIPATIDLTNSKKVVVKFKDNP